MIDHTQEAQKQHFRPELIKDKIQYWIGALESLIPKKPSKVIGALAHPDTLLPNTFIASDNLLTVPEEQENLFQLVEATPPDPDQKFIQPEISDIDLDDPIKDFDLLGQSEATKSGCPVLISRSLDCFPVGLEIYGRRQGGDVADLWKFINTHSHRWDIAVYRLPDGHIEITFDFPSQDYIRQINGTFFDSRYATVSDQPKDQPNALIGDSTELTEEAISRGWKRVRTNDHGFVDWQSIDIQEDDDHVVRGLNSEEMVSYLESGIVQSRGDIVNDINQKNDKNAFTYFFPGSLIHHSFSYASSGRIFVNPTFSSPGYVISMKRTEKIKIGLGDLYSEEPHSLDDVERIYEIRPISTKGNITVDVERHDDSNFGLRYFLGNLYGSEHPVPITVYAYKPVSLEEVRESLKPLM